MTLLARAAAPDLILHHGAITTLYDALPHCTAIACKDGRIVALGDSGDVLALAGSNTEIIDLGGRTVVPGFNDAHNHMLQVGIQYS